MSLGRAFAVLLSATLGGCGTLKDMHAGDLGRRVFGGARHNIESLFFPFQALAWPLPYLPPLDLPFSLVADVIFLPVTLLLLIRDA